MLPRGTAAAPLGLDVKHWRSGVALDAGIASIERAILRTVSNIVVLLSSFGIELDEIIGCVVSKNPIFGVEVGLENRGADLGGFSAISHQYLPHGVEEK